MKKLFTALLLPTTLYANYTIILDAGDTASHIHLFQHTETNIKDIFNESTTPTLSSFENTPENAGNSLKKLLDDTESKLNFLKIDSSTVPINVYGTESMRRLSPQKQQAIYDNVNQYLQHNYHFTINHIQSISGKMQAVYYWLDVNYLENFTNLHDILHIGNLSSEIAINENSTDSIPIKINGKQYNIHAESYFTLGQNTIFEKIKNTNTCFPINFPPDGNFNSISCGENYKKIIQPENLPTFKNSVVAFGNAYRIFDFLSAEIPDKFAFEARMNYACTLPWDAMKKEYDNLSEPELSQICANTVFIDQLFFEKLKLQATQLWVTDKINEQKIDWPLGAIFLDNLRLS